MKASSQDLRERALRKNLLTVKKDTIPKVDEPERRDRRRSGSSKHLKDLAGPQPLELELVGPGIDLLIGFCLADTVALLQLASQLLTVAIDLREIIVRQLAPVLLHVTAKLFPVSLDLIPGGRIVQHLLTPFLSRKLAVIGFFLVIHYPSEMGISRR